MKRLKIPRIPTRIPLPNLPSLHTHSHQKAKDKPKIDAALPLKAEEAPDVKSMEQTKVEKPVKQAKITASRIPLPSISKPGIPKLHAPKIPLPSLSKPGIPKLHAPKIPLPSVSKPGVPKLSVSKIPLPSVSIPSMLKISSSHKEKEDQKIDKSNLVAATAESNSGKSEQPEKKERPKMSMPKMPSLHKKKETPVVNQNKVPPIPDHAMTTDALLAPDHKEKPRVGTIKIHMPAIHKAKEKPVASAETAPAPQADEKKTPPETPKIKGKPKVSMPSLSLGKGGTRATGKRILALTIEGTDVRLVSYHNNSVESWKSVAFDARFLKMGQVADPEGLGEAIKNAVTGFETNRCYVVCALPGLRSVSRIITVPNVSKKEMETVVPREVRRTMTVSEEDNYFHWQVLPTEAAQTRVFVLAVPKEPISLLLRAFSHAGLNPANIDLKPLALMRAVNQKDAIIANCEGNSMELVIVSDDIPVLIRSVFLGEGVVNQDYAVGRISDELGRTIVTYNEINKEHPLDQDVPIYLTGAAASGVPFALNVAALTGRTVQPLEAPIVCPAELPIAEYMVNIGLILKVV